MAVALTLFKLGLSVARAKIATHLDQVVDVFYVTDRQGSRVEEETELRRIREQLLAAIDEAQ